MIRSRQAKLGGAALILSGLTALGIVLVGCGDSDEPQQPSPAAPASIEGGEMRLTLVAGGDCTGTDCFVDAGSTFTLAVEVLEAPAGYILLQTFIDYGVYDPDASEDDAGPGTCDDDIENGPIENGLGDGVDRMDPDCVVLELTYLPTASAADEIFWTDLEQATAVRADDVGPGLLGHGGITGLIPPLPESSETGVMVQVEMSCPAEATTVPISLLLDGDPLAKTNGTAFIGPDGFTRIIPKVASINLHCVTQ